MKVVKILQNVISMKDCKLDCFSFMEKNIFKLCNKFGIYIPVLYYNINLDFLHNVMKRKFTLHEISNITRRSHFCWCCHLAEESMILLTSVSSTKERFKKSTLIFKTNF